MTDDKVAISPKPCLQLQNIDHADFYQPFVSPYCCVIEVVLDLEKDDITVGIMAYYWNGGYTIGMVAILLKRWLTIGMVAIILK